MVPLKAQLTKVHDQEASHKLQLDTREARLKEIEVGHYLLQSAGSFVRSFMQSAARQVDAICLCAVGMTAAHTLSSHAAVVLLHPLLGLAIPVCRLQHCAVQRILWGCRFLQGTARLLQHTQLMQTLDSVPCLQRGIEDVRQEVDDHRAELGTELLANLTAEERQELERLSPQLKEVKVA